MAKKSTRKAIKRDEWYVKSIPEVAEFFGLAYETVRKNDWFRKVGRTAKGYYLPDLVAARHAQVMRAPQAQDENEGDEQEGRESKSSLEKEKIREDIRAKRRINDEEEGKLIDRSNLNKILVSWAVRFRAPLNALATQVSNLVPGQQQATVKRMVEDTVRNALCAVRDAKFTDQSIGELVKQEARELERKQ